MMAQASYAPRLVNKTVPSWTLDTSTGEYRSNYDGRTLSTDEVRQAVEQVIAGAKQEAAQLVTDLMTKRDADGNAVHSFEAAMLSLITSLHIIASAAAYGGIPGLVRDAETDLRAAVARERAYLSGFAVYLRKMFSSLTLVGALGVRPPAQEFLATNTPLITARATSYMDSALMTYERQRHLVFVFLGYTEARRVLHIEAEHCEGCAWEAGKGYVPIDELKDLGSEQCGQWCRCTVEYRKVGLHI